MKKITAIIFLAVLFLTINIANANPIYFYYLPTQAVTAPPDIHIQSPIQGGTQNSNITWLNFTVTKPASWFNNQSEDEYVPINGYSNNMPVVYFDNVKVKSWHYELDGIGGQSYPVEDLNGDSLVPEETFNFSNALTLDEGIHNLTVIVQSKSYYRDLGSRIGPQMDAQTHRNR